MKKLLILILSILALSATAQDTITTPSGLKYVRKTEGTGAKAQSHSRVKMFYKGTLPGGKMFDTNVGGKPFKFEIDNKEVIPGWDEGVKLMKAGEKGVLIVPAKLAYGKAGVRDPEDESQWIVPPNSVLVFEVELIEVK